MRYAQDGYHAGGVIDFVDDPVVSHSQSPAVASGEFQAIGRTRIISQP